MSFFLANVTVCLFDVLFGANLCVSNVWITIGGNLNLTAKGEKIILRLSLYFYYFLDNGIG